jgi:hypothetical protein
MISFIHSQTFLLWKSERGTKGERGMERTRSIKEKLLPFSVLHDQGMISDLADLDAFHRPNLRYISQI